MIGIENILILLITVSAAYLFVTEKLRVDLSAMCVLGALLVLQLIKPEQALYGFASSATATVAAMFVLSTGLVRTGLVEWLARRLDKIAGKGDRKLIIVLCITVALLSAFIINTATVAILIPVAIILAKSRKIAPSRILIPLSFASQFGGVCTLIGTSTNILVNSIAVSNGMESFQLFEFAPLGIILVIIGVLYLTFFSKILIPARKSSDEQLDKYRLAGYLSEMKVTSDCPFIDKRWKALKYKDLKNIDLIKIIRDKKATWRASATKIRENDVLLLHGNVNELIKIKNNYHLDTKADAVIEDKNLQSDKIKLIEALVPPSSGLIGKTLREADYIRRFGGIVLAVQRRGNILRDRLADIEFSDGDTLLLQCEKESIARIMKSKNLIVTNELTDLFIRKDKALTALIIFIFIIFLAALNILSILVAAIIGAIAMVLTRCITIEEAYESIDWKILFLLGGILPLGLALQQTGTASLLAGTVMKPLIAMGPYIVLAFLYVLTAALTELMSNNASAVLLVPIAISAAEIMGISAKPLLIAITFAASTSFATPIGYQTNTMIYTPGGYKFYDFARIGIPLNLLFWMVTVFITPLLWPF
ncbi:MAG: SLC13 family permease [Spirochaetes bacterium]|nr:SLC13 family permease [Spirochaetota bacterium]